MKRLLSIVLPLVVIVAALASTRVIKANKPEPFSRPPETSALLVEVAELQPSQYSVVIRSQGTVQPTVTNTLVPEVAGAVTAVAQVFVVGGQFVKGDVLVEIDRRDYEIALTQARANLAQADAQLEEQEALAERARAEWKSLGRRGTPSALTLREPQLAASKANRDAAEAQMLRADLDLQRTQLIAPYDGIVSARSVDPGQFVARGNPIGQIHALETVDVRLPLSSRQLTYLDTAGGAEVELSATVGGQAQRWIGKLERVEGVDAATQQLNIIVQVADPYNVNTQDDKQQPLRVGQYVNARIAGETLQDVFVIPRAALREEREVLVMDEQNLIERRAVTVAWSDDEQAAISDGLSPGDMLVITPLSTVADGTPVNVLGEQSDDGKQRQRLN